MRLVSLLCLAVPFAGCLPGTSDGASSDDTGELPVDHSDRTWEGAITITNDDDYYGTAIGDCEGTFTLAGPWSGPWCGTGSATCTDGLANEIAPESDLEICFRDLSETTDFGDRFEIDFLDSPRACTADVNTDLTCAYDWDVDVTPESLTASIRGEGFCGLDITLLDVTASRTN